MFDDNGAAFDEVVEVVVFYVDILLLSLGALLSASSMVDLLSIWKGVGCCVEIDCRMLRSHVF